MVHPRTTRRAGRMNPAVRFSEASIHSIPPHDTREDPYERELDRALMALVKSKSDVCLPRMNANERE